MTDIESSCLSYYLTSGGRIWGVKKEELLDKTAQKRREIIGNAFSRAEDAVLARSKLEAYNRIKDFLCDVDFTSNFRSSVRLTFNFPDNGRQVLENDLRLIFSNYLEF